MSIGARPSHARERPERPHISASREALGSSRKGTSAGTPSSASTLSTHSLLYPSPRAIEAAHTAIAPSLIDASGRVTMSSGSISGRDPRPSQVGHAPSGALNEKLCGESSSNESPQS